jgi:hypothetical protein
MKTPRLLNAIVWGPFVCGIVCAAIAAVASVSSGEYPGEASWAEAKEPFLNFLGFAFLGAALFYAMGAILIGLPLFLIQRRRNRLSVAPFVLASSAVSLLVLFLSKQSKGHPVMPLDLAMMLTVACVGAIVFYALAVGRLTFRSSGRPRFARPPLNS